MSKIQALVAIAKDDTITEYQEITFGNFPDFQAQEINRVTGIKVNGALKTLSTPAIKHVLKGHGTDKSEKKRGQKGVMEDDFTLFPEILSKYDYVLKGTNTSRGEECLKFIKQINLYW